MTVTSMCVYYYCDFEKLVETDERGSLNELRDWKRIPPVQVYQEVLSGRRKKFPAGFWFDGAVKYRCTNIGRYFFDEILKFKPEDVGTLDNALMD